MKKIRLGIFISGGGSNAKKIVEHFYNHDQIEIAKIVSNNSFTPLLNDTVTQKYVVCFSSEEMSKSERFIAYCKENFDYIILAGFLKLIPSELIVHFENKVINIHPAILPNYGGKGMYGMNVHKAVLENKEKLSGITIHYVNTEYDKGMFIAQLYTDISTCQTPEDVQKEVQKLEHAYFPIVIEKTLLNQ